MNSGTSFPAESVDGSTAQSRYDELVLAIGCNSSSLSASSLECLRNAPLERIVDATESLPKLIGPQGYYMSYVPRPDISNASDAFFSTYEFGPEQGIADVPIIVGGQEDECTLFAIVSDKVTTPAALIYQLQAQYPSTPVSVLEKFVSYYHGDAETGAPFRTDASQEAYPHSKINSAVVTDLVFAFQTRAFLAKITGSGSSPAVCPYKSGVWVYQGSYNHGLPFLGSYHGGDELLVGSGKPEGPYNDTVGSYIRFVGTGAPGSLTGGFEWPTYGESANVLRFNADGNEVIRDDSRKEAFDYFLIVQEQILF
jgi:acetylcholinesterase